MRTGDCRDCTYTFGSTNCVGCKEYEEEGFKMISEESILNKLDELNLNKVNSITTVIEKCPGCSTSRNIKNCIGCIYYKDEDQNQEVKADAGKPRVSLVPSEIVYAIARIREYGNSKYPEGGKDNWKRVSVERYRDAAYRHMLAYIDDPSGVDEESGFPHLWHLACNVAFLCSLEKGVSK